MTTVRSRAAGSYLRFLAWAAGLTAAAALVGYVPTWRLGGEEALAGLAAGCGIGFVASALGAIPIVLARGVPLKGVPSTMLATAVRLGVTLALGFAAALFGGVEPKPLLVWTALIYAVLLIVDTRFALAAVREER